MKLKYLFNKIFKTKSKVVTDYKDLEYLYIDTSNYSNVLNNIYNSINKVTNNFNYDSIMNDLKFEDYYTVSKFINTIHTFIVKDKSEYCIKIMEFIYNHNIKNYTIYHQEDEYIISFSLKPYDIACMIRNLIDNNIEDPIYNMILSNIENIISSKLLLLFDNIYQEDLSCISTTGFLETDYYYSENRVLNGTAIDDKLHIYILEDHYSNFTQAYDLVCQNYIYPFSVHDTIFELFEISIVIDNVYREVLDILLSNANTNIIVYNKDLDEESDPCILQGRVILNLTIQNIKNIIVELYSLINKYSDNNNKINLVMNATLIYNFLNERFIKKIEN